MGDPIFTWKLKLENEIGEASHAFWNESESNELGSPCLYCGESTVISHQSGIHGSQVEEQCFLCGWFRWDLDLEVDDCSATGEGVLQQFQVNDVALPIETLGAYLAQHGERISSLSWRRFEELAAAMFREQGYEVVLGRGTKDRGIDLLLLQKSDASRVIVQVKHTASRVGVSPIRELRGVQLRDGMLEAVLVTSNHFTRGARAEVESTYAEQRGFRLSLMDANDVAAALQLFRSRATSLANLEGDRVAARETVRRKLRE